MQRASRCNGPALLPKIVGSGEWEGTQKVASREGKKAGRDKALVCEGGERACRNEESNTTALPRWGGRGAATRGHASLYTHCELCVMNSELRAPAPPATEPAKSRRVQDDELCSLTPLFHWNGASFF
jgi:hypothetical protein